MIVNGKKYNIESLLKSIDFNNNEFEKIGNLMLTKKEIEILNKYSIQYQSSSSLRDLMMKISFLIDEEELDTDDSNDLEYVLDSISERAYYEETLK